MIAYQQVQNVPGKITTWCIDTQQAAYYFCDNPIFSLSIHNRIHTVYNILYDIYIDVCTVEGKGSSKVKLNHKIEVISLYPVIYFISRYHFQFLRTGSLNMCGDSISNANKLYLTLFYRYLYLISEIILITKYSKFFKHLVTAFDLKMVLTFCYQHRNHCQTFYQLI